MSKVKVKSGDCKDSLKQEIRMVTARRNGLQWDRKEYVSISHGGGVKEGSFVSSNISSINI